MSEYESSYAVTFDLLLSRLPIDVRASWCRVHVPHLDYNTCVYLYGVLHGVVDPSEEWALTVPYRTNLEALGYPEIDIVLRYLRSEIEQCVRDVYVEVQRRVPPEDLERDAHLMREVHAPGVSGPRSTHG